MLQLKSHCLVALFLANSFLFGRPGAVSAQVRASDVVKVTVATENPDGDGKQTLLATLTIAPSWHIYANPVENDFLARAQTTIRIYAAGKLQEAKIMYPAGKLLDAPEGLGFRIYEGKVTIKAVIARTKENAGPLEIITYVCAADNNRNLRPSSIKTAVP